MFNSSNLNTNQYNSENLWLQWDKLVTAKGDLKKFGITTGVTAKGVLAKGLYISLGGIEFPEPTSSLIRPAFPGTTETLAGKSRKEVLGRKYSYEIEWGFMDIATYTNLESVVNSGGPIYLVYKRYLQSEMVAVVLPELSERTHVAMTNGADFYSNVRVTLTEVLNRS